MSSSVAVIDVGEGSIRPLKVNIRMNRLLWAYEPIDSNTRIQFNLFGQTVSLRFENGLLSCPREVVYELSDNRQFQSFLNHHVEVKFVAGNDILGVSFFDPKIIQKKKMVLPIFKPRTNKKIGDFDLTLKIITTQTNYQTLQTIDKYLTCLEKKDPCELDRLYWRMKNQRIL